MIPFFPTPYPDELLYSICARYHQRSGHTSVGQTMREWFGSRQAAAVVDLPTRLQSVLDQLSPQTLHTARSLINSHTMFPLYRPFLPKNRVKRILRMMAGESRPGNVHMTAGQTASGVLPLKYLRFCPSCISDDELEYGEAYWHRSHQLPGVRVCNLHESWLVDSDIAVGGFCSRQALVPLGPKVQAHPEVLNEERYFCHHSWLAKTAYCLLNDPCYEQAIGHLELRRRYIYSLHRQGLASAAGRIEAQKLMGGFLKCYGEDFLAGLHCGSTRYHSDTWLLTLVRKYRKTSHPLHHLLLVKFLGFDIEDLLLGKPTREKRVDVKTGQRSQKQPSKRTSGDEANLVNNAAELERRRDYWLNISKAHPDLGTKALRQLQRADYAWLYRNDRTWLKEHSPKQAPLVPKKRIDWQERDVHLSRLIEQVAEAIKLLPGRPNRITTARITKGLGHMASQCKKLDRLPEARTVLTAVVETKAEFVIRRMHWAVEQLQQYGEPIRAYKVEKKAGLRPVRARDNAKLKI